MVRDEWTSLEVSGASQCQTLKMNPRLEKDPANPALSEIYLCGLFLKSYLDQFVFFFFLMCLIF